LTELLVARAGEILAIEKDARLVEVLLERFKALTRPADTLSHQMGEGRGEGEPVLSLLRDDALAFLRREPRNWSDWKLVSNLPYSVASPILVELAQSAQRPERMVVTLQLEVARRLMAKAGDKDYGVLTLLVQLDYDQRKWFKIPASCFFPAPDVDSACVVLERRIKPLLAGAQRETFVKIVKRAFSQRRKMMFKLLKTDWPEALLTDGFRAGDLLAQCRAEQVGLDQFVQLAKSLCASAPRRQVYGRRNL